MSFYDYVERHVFRPAGMTSTGYYPASGETPPGVAVGYTRSRPDQPLESNDGIREVRGGPAGGGYSTVDDLLAFARALAGGGLVRRETLARFTTPHADNGRYGFGFGIHGDGRGRSWGHGGGAPGMATWFVVWPERNLVAITLTNRDPGLLEEIQEPLMQAIGSR
jgi:CubicO group peptidase (beta-lactamase class C family)